MMHGRVKIVGACAVLALVPGCLPNLLQQERVTDAKTITRVIDPPPLRETGLVPLPPPAGGTGPTHEQEIVASRPIVTHRLAGADAVAAVPAQPPETTHPVSTPVEPIPVAEPPADPALVAAVRAYLEGDLPAARKHLGTSRSAPTVATQEELLALLAQLQERDLDQLPTEQACQILGKVERLARAVQARAPLTLDQLCFCRRIQTFGVYDPLPPEPSFQAGHAGQPGERVCVYAEVRNARTCHEGSHHVVALDGMVEILDADGAVVFRADYPERPDRSRSPRTDCFRGYEFNVPANLPPGRYALRVQVRDMASRQPREAARSLPFRVVESVAFDGR